MAERPGWIMLWRKLSEHWTWRKKPFGVGQAWVDLLLRVNFSTTTIPAPGKTGPATLSPGEAIISMRGLAMIWGWSTNRVVRFIRSLKTEHMIEYSNEHTFTRLKVLNWKDYQHPDSDSDTPADTPSNTVAEQRRNGDEYTDGTVTGDIRRRVTREEGKEGEEGKKDLPPRLASHDGNGDRDHDRAPCIERAKTKANLMADDGTKLRMLEFIGFLESDGAIPGARILDFVNRLWNLREGLVFDNGLPADKIFRYALDETMKAKAKSPSYVGKVIQNAISKWRDGALKF